MEDRNQAMQWRHYWLSVDNVKTDELAVMQWHHY
jgi:hypothetical protein